MRATSSPDPAGAFRVSAEGVVVAVRVQPRSRPEGLEGFVADAAGAVRLKARLGVAPEDGKANAALLKLLARAWDVAPSRLALVGGGKERNKSVLLAGEPAEALARLSAWAQKETE
jgi:uncharacterized protein YggU (UPF0235/DUF167 family)